MTVKVGQAAPEFRLKSHLGQEVSLSDYRGQNVVMVFFPLAWTPVWTAQIPSYQAELARFNGMKAQVLGLSVDSGDCLKAWAESLGGITYPLLSDFFPHGQVAQLYGVLRGEGYSERSIFIIDKAGVVRYVDVHDIGDQPDNEEIFRVLAELEPEAAKKVEQQEKLLAKMAWEQPRPEEDLIIYCTPWCQDCKQARVWLKERGIPFKEIDISKDRVAAKRVQAWCDGRETTPTFDYKGTIIVDWDLEKLQEVMGME